MRIGKLASTLVAAIAVSVAGYWYWSPHLAMRELHDAAQRGDMDALNARIDLPSVRDSLKGQVASGMQQQMRESKDNPFAALGAAIGMAFADQMLQVFVRPETIAAALRTGRWEPLPPGLPAPAAGAKEEGKLEWRYERQGMDRVIVHPLRKDAPPDPSPPAFVLARHGFADWKLAEIRIAPLTRN